jgi:hypothetical protein
MKLWRSQICTNSTIGHPSIHTRFILANDIFWPSFLSGFNTQLPIVKQFNRIVVVGPFTFDCKAVFYERKISDKFHKKRCFIVVNFQPDLRWIVIFWFTINLCFFSKSNIKRGLRWNFHQSGKDISKTIQASCNVNQNFDPLPWSLPNIRSQSYDPELDHRWKKLKVESKNAKVGGSFWKWWKIIH